MFTDWRQVISHSTEDELWEAMRLKVYHDAIIPPRDKVILLGSNPSCSSPYSDPFSHCQSANRVINQWLPALGLTRDDVHFMNVANYKTFNNKPLNKQLINLEIPRLKAFLKGRVVVTLGDTAWKAVQRASNEDVGVLATVAPLPHPSGRNRKLNDKELIKQQLQFAKYIIDGARR